MKHAVLAVIGWPMTSAYWGSKTPSN